MDVRSNIIVFVLLYMHAVFKMQNCVGGVNQDCVKAYSASNEEWKCFFPQYTEPYIKNKLFGLNSQYDTWQLGNILQLPCNPPKCTADQMKLFENFGKVSNNLKYNNCIMNLTFSMFAHITVCIYL